MKKVATSIKATLVVLALGFISIQAERRGYFDNLSIKSWLSSTKKTTTKDTKQFTPTSQKTPAKLVSVTPTPPGIKKDFFMGGLAKPYLKNGKLCNCIETTTAGKYQRGRVFSYEKLNLRKDFAVELDFYFGTRTDNGADGQIFMIHNDPRGNDAEGDYGEGLGYGTGRDSQGLAPSIGIEIDTYQNGRRQDPVEDHIAFLENGVVTHNNPDLPLVKMPELEDGKEHRFRFEWDASAKKIKVYWDKNDDKKIDIASELLFEVNRDLVSMLGTATPYWGISGATGDSYNLQYFCNPHGKLIYAPTEFCATYDGLADKSSVEGSGKVHPLLNISTSRGKARVMFENGKQAAYIAPNDKNAPKGRADNGCIGNGKGFADVDSKRLHDYVFTFENNAAVKSFSMQMLDFGDYNAAKANVQSAILVGYDINGNVVDTDSLIITKNSHGNLNKTGDACTAKPGEPGNYTFNLVGNGITKVKVLYYNDGTNKFGGNRPSDPKFAIGKVCFKMDANASPNPSAEKPECKAYAVHNNGGNSQFYTIDIKNHNFILPLGDEHDGADIQGVELHPVHGTLYAVSGNKASSNKGHLYKADNQTGELTPIGATGYNNITALAFNRMDNQLWGWANGTGLVRINLNTGKATVQAASNYQVSGLSWDKNGDKLYATSGTKLFAFNSNNLSITEVAHNLPGETSALEVRPDGLLMGAVSRSGAMTVFVYDLRTLQVVKQERLTTSYYKISAFAWADWCDIDDNIDIPAENCVAFNNVTPGTIVEGLGAIHPLLDIKSGGGVAKILVEGGPDKIYITQGNKINGCIGAGFADTRPTASRKHDYSFSFKPGTTVNSFSLRLVDYGDWNPSKATQHSAKLVAYDKDGKVVDTHELAHTTKAGKTVGTKGDACRAKTGEHGKYTFTVKGKGIAQIKLEFENNGSKYGGNRPSDPNIAINKVCFYVDKDEEPPLIPCDVSVFYANHTSGVNSKIYTTQTDLTNKTVTFNEFAELPFSDAHIALSLDGKRLYAVKGGGNNELGYIKLEDKSYHTVGYLNVGKVTQLAFAPNGKLYFTDNKKNEVYVIDNIDATLYTNLGKINLNNGFLNIAGGDIIFAQDGTFYVATAANGGRIYRVKNQAGVMVAEEVGNTPRKHINGIAILDHGKGHLVYGGKGKTGLTVVNPGNGSTYELAAKGDLDVLGYGDLSSSCMDLVTPPGGDNGKPLACDKVKFTKNGDNVTINNENDQEVVIYYSVVENGKETKKGNLIIDANTTQSFDTKVPGNGKLVFLMGSDNIPDSTVVTGTYCAVKTGTKIVVDERIEIIQVFEGKTYDARDIDWFVFKERQRLLDRNGNTVEESDKGVSLEDLTTIADEPGLKVDVQAGRIGYTDAIAWFKIEGGMPTSPQLLVNNLTSRASASGTVNGTIPAGTRMGFVLIGDVAAKNPVVQHPNAQLRFEGTRLQYSTDNGATWNTIPEHQLVYSIKAWNRNQHEGVVAGISDHPTKDGEKALTVVFEDIAGGYGDLDYEDVHCTVYMQGVTKLKTKIIKETKEVDVYTEIPCGDCKVTIEGEKNELECPDDAYRYKLSNGISNGANYHVWLPSFFIQGETARMTFEKEAYMDIKKDGSTAHLYGYATVTGSGGSSTGARYLVDVTFNKATSMSPKITLASQTDEVVKKWKFFEIDGNKATISRVGGGSNQVLKLTHKPANKQFGLQVGISASGQNVKFGAACWFFWEEVSTGRKGDGDFTLDLDNLCPDEELECPDNAFRHRLSNAVSDDAHVGNHDHSIWMPNLFVQGQKALFTFDNNAYIDITKDDTKAHIYGYATVTKGGGSSMGARYLVDVWFNRATGQMIAKKELKPGYQPDDVIKDWKFFEMDEANATMTRVNNGQVIKLTHRPRDKKMGLQVGFTANGKNVKYGASAWFYWEEVGTGKTGHGDFNLDLENLCPGQPLPNLCNPPIEVIYVLDISGSMKWEYPKTDADGKTISRFRAAQDALIYANSALAKQNVSSRSALVIFGEGKGSRVVSGFTNNYQQLNQKVEELDDPNGWTPMPRGMRNAKELLKTRDTSKLPVVILITDGVPNIDLNGRKYNAQKAEKIDIFNQATQSFRTKEEVEKMGGSNPYVYGTFNGKPLAEVMGLVEDMKSATSDLLIYGLGVQKDLNTNKGTFNDDILEYAAYKTGALYHTVDNAAEMVAAMADILVDATCKPHNTPKDPSCEILVNGVALTDSTTWNSVWNGQDDKVTVTLKNIKDPVNYNWKLTFPSDPSIQAVEQSGTFTQDGTYEVVIPIPQKGQWGNLPADGSGLFKANIDFKINTPCGNQRWEHIYYAPDKADVQVVKTVDKTNAMVGDTLTYTITVTNNGPRNAGDDSDASKSVKLKDILPLNLNVVSVTGGSFNGNGIIDLGAIGLGGSKTITVKVVTTTPGTVTNTATVISTHPVDPDTNNNTSSVQTIVIAKPKADLAITGTGPATAAKGSEATYNFTVTNNGPDNAENISITNGLPAGVTLVSSTESTITSLATGASASFEVKVKLDTEGTKQITSNVSNTVEDPNPANNIATVSTEVTFSTADEQCYPIFADRYIPGNTKGGLPILQDPMAAIGTPARNNQPGTYVSLGFGGEVTLIFSTPFTNGPGNDVRVVEASPAGSTCTTNPEKAEVFASEDGLKWVYLGTACGQNSDFDLGELSQAAFIRIIDISNPNDFSDNTADGFDVDGAACLHGAGLPTPTTLIHCSGSKLISFKAGTKQDGSALDAGNDPNQALGPIADPDNASQSVSLGFGGEIVIKYDYALFNNSGDDLEIIEHSTRFDCAVNPERIKVFASKDGTDWVLLGEGCMDSRFDLGTLKWAHFFKIVDISNPSDFTDANENGFDLDAIVCIGGGGSIFFDSNPRNHIVDKDITVHPNPAINHIDVNFAKLITASKVKMSKVQVQVTDIEGKQIGKQALDLTFNNTSKVRFNMTGRPSGIYIVKCRLVYYDSNNRKNEVEKSYRVIKE